jgi:hypothetical protein
MSNTSKAAVTLADKALRSKTSGEKWTETTAVPTLCAVSMALRISDAERKLAIAPHKAKMDKAAAPFKEILTALKERDTALRDRLLNEHPSAEGVGLDGVGNISFTEQWVYEIPNPAKVDPAYCTAVNDAKISDAINSGIRSIAGVKIYPERTVRVTPTKEA